MQRKWRKFKVKVIIIHQIFVSFETLHHKLLFSCITSSSLLCCLFILSALLLLSLWTKEAASSTKSKVNTQLTLKIDNLIRNIKTRLVPAANFQSDPPTFTSLHKLLSSFPSIFPFPYLSLSLAFSLLTFPLLSLSLLSFWPNHLPLPANFFSPYLMLLFYFLPGCDFGSSPVFIGSFFESLSVKWELLARPLW